MGSGVAIDSYAFQAQTAVLTPASTRACGRSYRSLTALPDGALDFPDFTADTIVNGGAGTFIVREPCYPARFVEPPTW